MAVNRAQRSLNGRFSYGNELYLRGYCLANETHFHMKVCTPGLVLKLRSNATRKCQAYSVIIFLCTTG